MWRIVAASVADASADDVSDDVRNLAAMNVASAASVDEVRAVAVSADDVSVIDASVCR